MANSMNSVIRIFYPYFWYKFKFLDEDYTETEYIEEFKVLREAVWVHRIVSFSQWRHFLESPKNLLSMISSREVYVSTVFFMVSSTIKDIRNIHESFLTICSLVTAVAAYVHNKGYKKFKKYCPDILEVLFEEYFSKVSDREKIRDHFRDCNYSDAYEMVEQKTNGNPFADIVNDLDFVNEIREKIKSEISVQEHAAVYRCTTEVIKRYETRTSRNNPVTSKENVSTQTEGSLQNLEAQKEFEIGQTFLTGLEIFNSTDNEQIKLVSGQKLLMGLTELINLKISQSQRQLLRNEEISSHMEPSHFVARKNILGNEQSLASSKVAEGDYLKFTGSAIPMVLEDLIPNTPEVVISETNPYQQEWLFEDGRKDIIPKTSSPHPESSLEDARKPQIFGNDQSSSPFVEEQSIHITEKSRTLNFEETEAKNAKFHSPIPTKMSFQEDLKQPRTSEGEPRNLSATEEAKDIKLKQPRTPEGEPPNPSATEEAKYINFKQPRTPEGEPRNLSATEGTNDINSMRNSSLQLQGQSLQNNMRERKTSNKGQRIPVRVTNSCHTDDSSQFESGNPTEDSHSDSINDSETTNQNVTHQTPEKSKKKKKKKSKKKKKNSNTNKEIPNSNNVEDGKDVDLKNSPYSEEQTLRNKENPTEINEGKQSSTNVEVDSKISPYSEELLRNAENSTETNEKSSTIVEANEAAHLEISPISEEESTQNKENPIYSEESLLVPDNKEVIIALMAFNQKLINSLSHICYKFKVPLNILKT